MSTSAVTAPEPTAETGSASPARGRRGVPFGSRAAWLRRSGLLVLCVVSLLAAGRWIQHRYTHVSTDDARIAADLTAVSSRVAGRVVAVSVRQGDRIEVGSPIAALDDRESKLWVEEIAARLRVVEQEIAENETRREMIDRQTSGHAASQRSRLNAALAGLESAEAELAFTRSEFERGEELVARNAISHSARERLLKEFKTAEQKQHRAEALVMEARSALLEAEAARAELVVLDSSLAGLAAQGEALRAQLARQQLDLDDRTIRSPLSGVVDATFIKAGEYVRPGQRLVTIHDPDEIWVRANIKETQIRRLHAGQDVEVQVDAYPDRVFHGSVERIGHAATSQFALLPSPNPSGNFTKIAQRLPVRIALDQTGELLRPGMMVVVDIDVRDD